MSETPDTDRQEIYQARLIRSLSDYPALNHKCQSLGLIVQLKLMYVCTLFFLCLHLITQHDVLFRLPHLISLRHLQTLQMLVIHFRLWIAVLLYCCIAYRVQSMIESDQQCQQHLSSRDYPSRLDSQQEP